MIRAKQPRLVKLSLIERLAVATLAQRRQHTERSVMMASLTHYIFVAVEIARNPAALDVFHQLVDDLLVRQLDRLVFLRQNPDGHGVGNITVIERQPRLPGARFELVQ